VLLPFEHSDVRVFQGDSAEREGASAERERTLVEEGGSSLGPLVRQGEVSNNIENGRRVAISAIDLPDTYVNITENAEGRQGQKTVSKEQKNHRFN
jgi:hypothetical protein